MEPASGAFGFGCQEMFGSVPAGGTAGVRTRNTDTALIGSGLSVGISERIVWIPWAFVCGSHNQRVGSGQWH